MTLLFSSMCTLRLAKRAVRQTILPSSYITSLSVTSTSLNSTPKRLTQTATGSGGNESGKKPAKTIALSQIKNYFQLTKDIGSTPAAPLALGFSGLIPFFYPPVAMLSAGVFDPTLTFAHLTYGATILSFIGGLRWGYCLSPSSKTPPSWLYLGYSVAPQLAGWASLLMPTSLGVLTVITGLVACAAADVTMPGYPSWFVSMRVILTTGAVISLILSLWCAMMLK